MLVEREGMGIAHTCQTCRRALVLMGPSVIETEVGKRFLEDCRRILPLCADCSMLAWERTHAPSGAAGGGGVMGRPKITGRERLIVNAPSDVMAALRVMVDVEERTLNNAATILLRSGLKQRGYWPAVAPAAAGAEEAGDDCPDCGYLLQCARHAPGGRVC